MSVARAQRGRFSTSASPSLARLVALLGALVATSCGAPRAHETAPRAEHCATDLEVAPEAPRLDRREAELLARFDRPSATALVAFLDRFVRLRGNAGYEASLEALRARLLAGGFAETALEVLPLGPEEPTWRPLRASLALTGDDGAPELSLHAFDDEAASERLALLPGSGAADGVFEVTNDATDARGKLLFGRASAERLGQAAKRAGAAGILSHHLHPVAAAADDPAAIGFQYLPDASGRTFGFSLSADAAKAIERRLASGRPARVRVHAEVERGAGHATTLVAHVAGEDPALAPVALFAHLDEPGAVDNASGAVALVELAVALRSAIDTGAIERPRRSIVFLAGQELESVPAYLERTASPPFAALVLDMVGAAPGVVSAPLLLERMPDPENLPGTLDVAPSGWGAPAVVEAAALHGHFLSAYVALAMDRLARARPSLAHRSHAFEGGSDHVPFLDAGVPAVLLWHFPDDAYHTSRDRASRVSAERMAEVAALAGAAALGLASGATEDGAEMLAGVRAASARHRRHARALEAFTRYDAEAARALSSAGLVDAATGEHAARAIEAGAACARSTR